MTADISAQDRLHWLRRTARTWILAIVLLAVAVLVGASLTLGLFSSTSTNPQNVVSAGSMSQVNSADDAAIMGAADMVPGTSVEGTSTIRNAGGARGDFTLTVEDVHDQPGPNGGKLSTQLKVKVYDDDVALPVYNGPLDDLDVSLGIWEPEEERSYRFVVTFPASPTAGGDNPFQLSKVTATFKWHAMQVP